MTRLLDPFLYCRAEVLILCCKHNLWPVQERIIIWFVWACLDSVPISHSPRAAELAKPKREWGPQNECQTGKQVVYHWQQIYFGAFPSQSWPHAPPAPQFSDTPNLPPTSLWRKDGPGEEGGKGVMNKGCRNVGSQPCLKQKWKYNWLLSAKLINVKADII